MTDEFEETIIIIIIIRFKPTSAFSSFFSKTRNLSKQIIPIPLKVNADYHYIFSVVIIIINCYFYTKSNYGSLLSFINLIANNRVVAIFIQINTIPK